MDFSIRQIKNNDHEAVLELYRQAIQAVSFDEYPQDILNEWASRTLDQFQKQNETRQRYVALLDDQVVGYSGLDVSEMKLTECYVSPNAAGRKIGRSLVGKVVEEARAASLPHLDVMSALNAVDFYARCGFQETETGYLEMANGQKMRCLWMRLTL